MSAISELQTAVFLILDGNITVNSKVVLVCDHINQDTETPYIRFGKFASARKSTHDRRGLSVNMKIRIVSSYEGNDELQLIEKELNALLADVKINTTPEWSVIACYEDGADYLDLQDGERREAILSYRVDMLKDSARTVLS